MSDLDLIEQLGELLGRPLDQLPEARFERHAQAKYVRDGAYQDRIERDAYSLGEDGTVSGLFLQPVTSYILQDFPFSQLKSVKHLSLSRVDLSSYGFLPDLKELTTLDLSNNHISDGSFLRDLKELTMLDLSFNYIPDGSFLHALKELTKLDLSFNSISDGSFLPNLKGLTTLDLSSNDISDGSFLQEITSLENLNLGDNSISDGSFLRGLKKLTALNLSNNSISDGSFLRGLKKLTTLDLGGNKISDGSFLHGLRELKNLNLLNNSISNWSFLRGLKGLKKLNLSDNSIFDGSFLRDLKGLETLDLSYNRISVGSFLHDLKGLKTLDLRSNYISDGSFLQGLKGLKILCLSYNRISDSSFLQSLEGLVALYLSGNVISDGSFLRNLKGLKTLYLRSNSISDWSFLRDLKELTTLDLRSNNISDVSFLRKLKELKTLDLSSNSISDGSFLRELKELKTLNLSSNSISDGSFLQGLTSLEKLNLSSNSISEIPRWLAASRMAIKMDDQYGSASNCIHLYNNPIAEPPLEIASQGNEAILNYYNQLTTQGQNHLYEAKMLIVGEGEAGKTTLAHKIPEPDCPLPHVDDRTRGISIQTHTFPCRNQDKTESSEPRNFHLNIWDFGGQEIYHYTHRFFLSKRSLYVLVADNRKDDTDFNYWLNIIERFADNSPLIIVLNEKGDIQRSLNQADLKGRYAESIKDIRSVNFKTQEESDPTKKQQRLKAINALVSQIEYQAQTLPHIGEPVPARWVDVRQAIEKNPRNHIYREQFDDICKGQDITNLQDIDTLLSYFHDLGILLHFVDNPLLRNHVILKPTWATNAVYCIFDNDAIKAKAGRFSRQNCIDIWCDVEYRHMSYVLIELMKSFRLVYEIGTTGELVAPQLLPSNTPIYPWDGSHNSHMQLRYDAFMPKGIFWQLAVTLYRYIPNHDWIWRNGMVIRRGNTWAEIKEDLNLRRISLRFSGPSIAEFRAVIVDELDAISQSYHQLQYDKMIPCQCSECLEISEPHFFKYNRLKIRQESGKKSTIECELSEEDVSLRALLEGFDVETIVKTLPDKTGAEPTPPEPSAPPTMQTLKIFLASSAELKADREQFEIFINRKNKELVKTGVFLELVIWEDFLAALSKTRSQDEYNQAIQTSDVFVILAYTKVGQYTEEEFMVALETFKNSDKPLIFTYFKDAAINMSSITPEIMTLLNFKQKLSDMGHFYQNYTDSTDLKHQFGEQLTKFLPKLTGTDS